jgi:hypothetical protein
MAHPAFQATRVVAAFLGFRDIWRNSRGYRLTKPPMEAVAYVQVSSFQVLLLWSHLLTLLKTVLPSQNMLFGSQSGVSSWKLSGARSPDCHRGEANRDLSDLSDGRNPFIL